MRSERFVELIQSFGFKNPSAKTDVGGEPVFFSSNRPGEQTEAPITGFVELSDDENRSATLFLSFEGDLDDSEQQRLAEIGALFIKTASDYHVGYVGFDTEDLGVAKQKLEALESVEVAWRRFPVEPDSMGLLPFVNKEEESLFEFDLERASMLLQENLGADCDAVDVPPQFVVKPEKESDEELDIENQRSFYRRAPKMSIERES